MPSRGTHAVIGGATSLGLGLYQIKRREDRLGPGARDAVHDALQVAGTTILGAWFSRLPDVLEPATSPRHRKGAHSIAAGSAAASIIKLADHWEDACRAGALHCRRKAEEAEDLLVAIFYRLGEVVCCFAAAVPAAFVAGYCSHLAADGFTPAGIPFV